MEMQNWIYLDFHGNDSFLQKCSTQQYQLLSADVFFIIPSWHSGANWAG